MSFWRWNPLHLIQFRQQTNPDYLLIKPLTMTCCDKVSYWCWWHVCHVTMCRVLHCYTGHVVTNQCLCVTVSVGSWCSYRSVAIVHQQITTFYYFFLTFNTKIDCLMRPWMVNNKSFKRKVFFEDFKWPFIVQMMSWHTALSHGY